jgi:beta-glucosidase
MYKQLIIICLAFSIVLFSQCKSMDKKTEKEIFIEKLMKQMTLEEKLGQMNLLPTGDITTGQLESSDIAIKIKEGKVGGLFNIKSVEKIRELQKLAVEESRLKIPLLFGMDVIHGYETTFPIPLGLSCSWDMDLIKNSARIAAQEATAAGINWTFSPMVDLSRDPRWGRIAESSGEDPYLGSCIATAMVQGYQGLDLSANNTLLSCVKHFALYGAPEGGRDYNTVDMSRIRMYNEYFPPYKAAVDAGVGSVMASFNEVDGIPATGNKWLLTEVLRKQWSFKGFVVSDYTGINEMIEHGIGDLKTSSALALNAGLNMDMVGEGFLTTLTESLNESKISLTDIDNSVRLILSAKYDLGLFQNPYKYCDTERSNNEIYTDKNRKTAQLYAAESMVLLKNQNNILPLKIEGKIALIGPLADSKENMAGTWSVATKLNNCISLFEGLKSVSGNNAEILYAKGSNLTLDSTLEANSTMFGRELGRNKTNEELLKEALIIANQSDIIIAALGESSEMSGESSSRTNLHIPDAQRILLNELKKTGKPIILVLFTGRPLILVDEYQQVDAILNAWFAGSEAGFAIADVLFGVVNPSGKLTTSFPRSVGQIPIYYNFKNTGRPVSSKDGSFEKFRSNYLDEKNTPLFPFGYGLSYTNFKYSNLRTSKSKFTASDSIAVSIDIENTGNYDGKEIIQLYIRDWVGSITRPVLELKDFRKVYIKKGDKKSVAFTISASDLKFYNSNLEFVAEPGEFSIFVGSNSADVLETKIELISN